MQDEIYFVEMETLNALMRSPNTESVGFMNSPIFPAFIPREIVQSETSEEILGVQVTPSMVDHD